MAPEIILGLSLGTLMGIIGLVLEYKRMKRKDK